MYKHILVVLFGLYYLSLYSQDFRDNFIGTYYCERHELDDLGGHNIFPDTLIITKTTTDTITIIVNNNHPFTGEYLLNEDSTFYMSSSETCNNGFFYNNDSIYIFNCGTVTYKYYGKKVASNIVSKRNIEYLHIYPNPVSNNLIVEINLHCNSANYTIYNFQGKTVLNGSIVKRENIDTSHLESGIYFIKIITDDNLINVEKIIIK